MLCKLVSLQTWHIPMWCEPKAAFLLVVGLWCHSCYIGECSLTLLIIISLIPFSANPYVDNNLVKKWVVVLEQELTMRNQFSNRNVSLNFLESCTVTELYSEYRKVFSGVFRFVDFIDNKDILNPGMPRFHFGMEVTKRGCVGVVKLRLGVVSLTLIAHVRRLPPLYRPTRWFCCLYVEPADICQWMCWEPADICQWV